MFGSKPKAAPSGPTVIGRGCLIEGTVRASGFVQVDGRIDGALFAEGCHVVVGLSGHITGDLVAQELVIGGSADGAISVLGHLHVGAQGSVYGAVCYGSLTVERGGVVIGRVLHDGTDAQLEAATETSVTSAPPLPASEPARA